MRAAGGIFCQVNDLAGKALLTVWLKILVTQPVEQNV